MAGLDMRAQMMGKMKKPKKSIDHIRAAEAENGGHTTYLHHTDEMAHPPEGPHIFPKGEAVPVMEGHIFHHLAKHLHIPHEVMGKEEEHEPTEEQEMMPADGEE